MPREPFQGAWIKYHRELLELTQGELTKAVRDDGVRLSRSHLANIEAGTYAAPPELVRVIAARCGLDVRDTWRYVGTLARTRNDHGPTLHQLSPVGDTGPAPSPGIPETPAPPRPDAPATELLDWARSKLASLATGHPDQVVLTTMGPLAEALRAAPSPDGLLGGILGRGIRAVLESGACLHHILAVPDDPEAHFEVLAQALPLAARYCLPVSPDRPHLSRYSLSLVPESPAGLDLVASSRAQRASMILPVISAGERGVTVVDTAVQDGTPGPVPSWTADHAAWLADRGTELFSWVTVVPGGTLSLPEKPWEEQLTEAWRRAGGRDSIQRMLPLNTMSDGLRRQIVTRPAARRSRAAGPPGTDARADIERRLDMFEDRRGAMIRNLRNGYAYRNVVTREALDDLVRHGQYRMERVPGNVLNAEQRASYLQATIELINDFGNFEVLLLTDEQLEQALPLGVSWIVKRSPRTQTASTERAWGFLPYVLDGEPKAMNVVVSDKLAIEAIGSRIDALWATWAQGRASEEIRQETLAELRRAQRDIPARRP